MALFLSFVTLGVFVVASIVGIRLLTQGHRVRREALYYFTGVAVVNALYRSFTLYLRTQDIRPGDVRYVIELALGLQILLAVALTLHLSLLRLDRDIVRDIAKRQLSDE